MPHLVTFLKKISLCAMLGALLGLVSLPPMAQAANPLEMNFGLFGPRYDGALPPKNSSEAM